MSHTSTTLTIAEAAAITRVFVRIEQQIGRAFSEGRASDASSLAFLVGQLSIRVYSFYGSRELLGEVL